MIPVALLLVSGCANAQEDNTDTLAALAHMVAESDTILLGRIDTADLVGPDKGKVRPGLVVDVTSILQGSDRATRLQVTDTRQPDSVRYLDLPRSAMKAGTEYIFFLRRGNDQHTKEHYSVRYVLPSAFKNLTSEAIRRKNSG